MKNVVLASVLASVTTAFAVPSIAGPVHFAVTRPFNLYAPTVPGNNSVVALGVAPLDFVLTDVIVGDYQYDAGSVTVNGAPVLSMPLEVRPNGNFGGAPKLHMSTGIFIPAGSTIGFMARTYNANTISVTVAGYVQ